MLIKIYFFKSASAKYPHLSAVYILLKSDFFLKLLLSKRLKKKFCYRFISYRSCVFYRSFLNLSTTFLIYFFEQLAALFFAACFVQRSAYSTLTCFACQLLFSKTLFFAVLHLLVSFCCVAFRLKKMRIIQTLIHLSTLFDK